MDRDLPKDIKLYPNPAVDNLTITLNKEFINSVVSIIDMQGKICNVDITQKYMNKVELDITGLKSGLYIIQLKTADAMISVRFTKQ